MPILYKKSTNVGLPQGNPVHIDEKRDEKIRIIVTAFDGEIYEEKEEDIFNPVRDKTINRDIRDEL